MESDKFNNLHQSVSFSGNPISFGVLTVSDTCCYDISLDKSGPTAVSLLQEAGHNVMMRDCVNDDSVTIHSTLIKWIKSGLVEVILTIGGTGLTQRDVTSDTILNIISQNRRLTGIEHYLYSCSFNYTPMAALSRFVAGVCDKVLLITLPGSVSAARQCIPVLLPILSHAVNQIKGRLSLVKSEHIDQYNPKNLSESCKSNKILSVVNRSRKSIFPMLSVDEALTKLYEAADSMLANTQVEAVYYKNAIGRVLGCNLKARQSIPPFNVSIMDGYAVRFIDGTGQYEVIGSLCAGDNEFESESIEVTSGKCVRVSTGGPIPRGADCVVPVENTKLLTKHQIEVNNVKIEEEDTIEILTAPQKVGQFVRPCGFDLKENDIFHRGLRLGPAEIGLLSGAGLLAPWPSPYIELLDEFEKPLPTFVVDLLSKGGYIPCVKQLKIGVMSTGREIVNETAACTKSCIRDNNRPILINLLSKYGYSKLIDLGILSDDLKELESGFRCALLTCDIVITTGGVSMGERDLVSHVLCDRFGATVHFGQIFMKPGKPTTFLSVPQPKNLDGSPKSVLVLCLPGNPVSTYVTAHLFVLPLLRKIELRPEKECFFPRIHVRLLHAVKLDDRPDYRRAKLIWKPASDFELEVNKNTKCITQPSIPCAVCDHLGSQMSSRLASCFDSNLLLILPPVCKNKSELLANSIVEALIIDNFN